MDPEFEKLIREREEMMRKLTIGSTAMQLFDVESLPFLICVFDLANLKFVSVSRSVKRILGYDIQEMEGKKFIPFVIGGKELEESIRHVDENLLNNINVSDYVNHYRHKDGIHAVPLTWYAGSNTEGQSFCIALPGDKQKIKSQ